MFTSGRARLDMLLLCACALLSAETIARAPVREAVLVSMLARYCFANSVHALITKLPIILVSIFCRCIQPEHLGVLALPVAEFLALLHQTAYLGYSQRSSGSSDHAFFAGSPKVGERVASAVRLLGPGIAPPI